MRLPAELRVKILRMLLKSPDPLDASNPFDDEADSESTSADTDDDSEPEGCSKLSAQLLSCCQQLYAECAQVLYEENSLEVCCDWEVSDWPATLEMELFYCRILGDATQIPTKLKYLDGLDDSLLHHASKCAGNRFNSPAERKSAKRLGTMLPATGRFRHIRMHVVAYKQKEIFIACRVLKDLLSDKDVVMSFYDRVEAPWLRSCLILRCRSIEFPDFRTEATKSLTHTMNASTAVKDKFRDWQKLVHDLLPQLAATVDYKFEYAEADLLKHMKQSVLDYNPAKAASVREEILQKAIAWNTRWTEEEPVKIRKRAKEDIAMVETRGAEAAEALTKALAVKDKVEA